MTELVNAYTSNGYLSEDQYELLLFKKAKAVLQIEFQSRHHRDQGRKMIEDLILQQTLLSKASMNVIEASFTDEVLELRKKMATEEI